MYLILILAVQFATLACGKGKKGGSLDPSPALLALEKLSPAVVNQDLVKNFLSDKSHPYSYESLSADDLRRWPSGLGGFYALPLFPSSGDDSVFPPRLTARITRPQGLGAGIIGIASSRYFPKAQDDNCLVFIDQTGGGVVDFVYEARKDCMDADNGCSYTGKARGRGILDLIEGKIDYDVSVEGYGMSCPERENYYHQYDENAPASFPAFTVVGNGDFRAEGEGDTSEEIFNYFFSGGIKWDFTMADQSFYLKYDLGVDYQGNPGDFSYSAYGVRDYNGPSVLKLGFINIENEDLSPVLWEHGKVVTKDGITTVNMEGKIADENTGGGRLEFALKDLIFDQAVASGEYPSRGRVEIRGDAAALLELGETGGEIYYDWTLDGAAQPRDWLYSYFEQGKMYMRMGGDFINTAIGLLEKIGPESPDYGAAQYGILLAKFLDAYEDVAMVMLLIEQNLIYGSPYFSPYSPYSPQVDGWLGYEYYADLAKEKLKEVDTLAEEALSRGWEIEFDNYLMEYSSFLGNPSSGMPYYYPPDYSRLSGRFGEVEARLMGFMANLWIAIYDLLAAQSFVVEDYSFIDNWLSWAGEPVTEINLIPYLRFYGAIFQDNPYLLTQSTNRWDENFPDIDDRLAKAFRYLYDPATGEGFVKALGKTPPDGVVHLEDNDGSLSVSSGDKLDFQVEILKAEDAEDYQDLLDYLENYFPSDLAANAEGINGMLAKLIQVFEAVDAGGEAVLDIDDLNPLLKLAGFPEIPNLMRFDVGQFFRSETALRELLPVINEEKEFIIEVEAPAGSVTPQDFITFGDTAHFPDGLTIPADGIAPGAGQAIEYFAWAEPSVNDSFWINLGGLQGTWDGATDYSEGGSEFRLADNYSRNKTQAWLRKEYLEKYADGKLVDLLIGLYLKIRDKSYGSTP